MIAEEGSSDEWGGLSAITILARQHHVRIDVYDEIGDHVQQVQADEVALPLLIIVWVNYTMPPNQDTSVKAKSNKKNWSNDESFDAALNEWKTNPPEPAKVIASQWQGSAESVAYHTELSSITLHVLICQTKRKWLPKIRAKKWWRNIGLSCPRKQR